MRNKIHQLVVIIFVASLSSTMVFAAGNGSTPNGKPFIELAGQIIEVQSDISSFEADHQALIDRVDALETDLQGKIDAINAEIINLQTTDAALQVSLTTVINGLIAQGLAIDDLLLALSDVNYALVNLANMVGDNSAAIADLEAQKVIIMDDIAALDAGVVTAIAAINDNTSLIQMLEDDIAALEINKQNDVEGTCPAGTSVTTVRNDGTLECGTTNSVGEVVSMAVFGPIVNMNNSVSTINHCHIFFFGCISNHAHNSFFFANRIAFAVCLSGYRVSGGGHQMSTFERLQVTNSYPASNFSWAAVFHNYVAGNTSGRSARATAQCIKIQ